MNGLVVAAGTAAVKSKVNSAVGGMTGSSGPKATGYLGPYCPSSCPLGLSTGSVVRLSLLFSMIFFLFIAMCSSSLKEFKYNYTLSNNSYSLDCKCTHTQKLVCEGTQTLNGVSNSFSIDEKFKDLSDSQALQICADGADEGRDKNFSGAEAFIGCTAFAWLLMLANIPILVAFDKPFLVFNAENIYYINGALGFLIWIFLTSNWGSWTDQNCCGTNADHNEDVKNGAGWSLAVFVWILDLFYLAFCIPDVEEVLFGEK